MSVTKLRVLSQDIDMGSTALFKLIGLSLGVLANFGAVAIITREFGVIEYASYALIASFLFLLPFADLGLGAGIINATSDLRAGRITPMIANRIVGRGSTVLICVGIVFVSFSASLWGSGGWIFLLGSLGKFEPAVVAATYTLLSIAIALPFGIGSRILQGCGKVRLNVQLGLINPLFNILLLSILLLADAPIPFYLAIPASSYLLVTVVTYVVARKVSGIKPTSLTASWARGATEGFPLMGMAIPFFIVSVGTALGLQSHRLILAHMSDPVAVASYSFVAQFAGPLCAVVITAGQNLWSKYRNVGMIDRPGKLFVNHLTLFLGLGVMAAVALIATVPAAESILTGGRVEISFSLVSAAALYILVVAVHQPGSMYLTDTKGLYGQAVMVIAMSAFSIIAMVALIPHLGVFVTYVASAFAMLAFQLIPTWFIVLNRTKQPRIGVQEI